MKKRITHIAAIALLGLFTACNDSKEELAVNATNTEISVVESPEAIEKAQTYAYVTAPSGLSLRAYNNLDSEKLTVMPYGTRVTLVTIEENETMTVSGIKGGMNEIEYNNKTGFAFNGYLSSIFPPEKNSNAKQYIEDLQATHPAASYTQATGGTASNPTKTVTILVPTIKWQEGFLIAQRLFDVPLAFATPSPVGSDKQTVFHPKKNIYIHQSELSITRAENQLKELVYKHAEEGYSSTVSITQNGEMMKIESIVEVD